MSRSAPHELRALGTARCHNGAAQRANRKRSPPDRRIHVSLVKTVVVEEPSIRFVAALYVVRQPLSEERTNLQRENQLLVVESILDVKHFFCERLMLLCMSGGFRI